MEITNVLEGFLEISLSSLPWSLSSSNKEDILETTSLVSFFLKASWTITFSSSSTLPPDKSNSLLDATSYSEMENEFLKFGLVDTN